MLAREAERVGTTLAEALEEEDVELRLGALAEEGGEGRRRHILTLKGGEELSAERLLVATGRKPNVDVGLDTVGIEPGNRGIEVDERLRAGDGIWAIGDVNGVMLFTRRQVPGQDRGPGHARQPGSRRLPRGAQVVFTDPQVTAVGASEEGDRDLQG